jgi:metal-responsive CopG/Arc/MetJ family transcriptional regulator
MPERRVTTFRIDEDLLQGLQAVWERDGVQPSEQVRRAIRAWLEAKGAIKPERKRAATHKRSSIGQLRIGKRARG